MYMITIVEDDRKEAESLEKLVREYFVRHSQPCYIHIFGTSMDFIKSRINHDIVFMDIRMDQLDGLEVARLMRKVDESCILIFVTHMAQLAIKGYEVDALDFIVKPADEFSIGYVLDKALKRLREAGGKVVPIKTPDGLVMVMDHEILYVEVYDHNLIYHTLQGDFTARGRLLDVKETLGEERFVSCNRSFLVNLRHVSGIEGDSLFVGRVRISISKPHRKEILARFSDYVGASL